MHATFKKYLSRIRSSLYLTINIFSEIDGAQRAGAFAFYAFFALFPLVVLLVTIASLFVDPGMAENKVIAYVESYIPLSEQMQHYIFDTVEGVIDARGEAGIIATLMLVWAARHFFTTLIFAANRAWGTEMYNWWRLPMKSLVLLGIMIGAVFVGMAIPMFVRMAQEWIFPLRDFSFFYALWNFLITFLVVFFSLSLFYMLAPRRPTRFAEVWAGALCSTVLLRMAESLFVIYLEHFAVLNAVYGAFGGIMALLLWIYLSGGIVIFGACLCAAQAEAIRNLGEAA